jgi:hypothetical protein
MPSLSLNEIHKTKLLEFLDMAEEEEVSQIK